MITFNGARHYQELLGGDVEQSIYDYSALFRGSGWLAGRRAAARFRLIKKIDVKLSRVLRQGERVHFVAKGSLASMAERFFAGHAVAYHVNLRALVFTNERVIIMKISAGLKPRDLVSELPYTSILKLTSTWSGLCEVKLANGRTHRFAGIPRADRKFLRDFLGGVVTASAGTVVPGGESDGLMHLCPHCFANVPGRPRSCERCGGGIKLATTAALLSLGLPGLGDWYLGHRWFAVFEMIGAAMLWVVFVIRPLDEELSHIDGMPLGAGFWVLALGIVGGAHLTDAGVTYSFGRKGHHAGKVPVVTVG
ncbi:MAG: hypothetical protein WC205_12370 [Opitutaceae bacterium]|jgi:hypothetical protein